MAAANQLYEAGAFQEAAAQYEALIDAGVQDGGLFYNLGVTYFKIGDLGHAVLNFRRAQVLLPRDPDVIANLELARSRTVDQIDQNSNSGIASPVRQLFRSLTVDEMSLAALLLWVMVCGFIAGAILWRQRRRTLLYASGALLIILILGLASTGLQILDGRHHPPAVVVAEETSIRSGPGTDYLTQFTLHAGTEVRLIERREEWVRITIAGDLQGWTPSEGIAELWPSVSKGEGILDEVSFSFGSSPDIPTASSYN